MLLTVEVCYITRSVHLHYISIRVNLQHLNQGKLPLQHLNQGKLPRQHLNQGKSTTSQSG